MPTYEYECQDCGEQSEVFQKMSDPPKTTCEKCGGKLTKLLSAGSGLIFKGSGFYITDYKAGGEKKSEESKPAEKKAEPAKTESKPAEKKTE